MLDSGENPSTENKKDNSTGGMQGLKTMAIGTEAIGPHSTPDGHCRSL